MTVRLSPAPTPARRRRQRAPGFTLVELMISLVMGLIVAMAAVGLARTATSTFHEQARLSVTEMAVRSGSERLRQDLSRVSYMTTGNISVDPKTAHRSDLGVPYPARIASLKNLRGLRINVGGSPLSTAAANGLLASDSIDLVGNYTTDDSYSGTITSGGTGCAGQSQLVTIDPALDAGASLLRAGSDALLATNGAFAFQPSGKGIVQVTDGNGCKHYAPVCSVAIDGSVPARLLVSIGGATIDAKPPVMLANDAFGGDEGAKPAGSCGTSDPGPVTIAPLSWIRWQLIPTQVSPSDPTLEGVKYDIVRSVCDWSGYGALPPACNNPTNEVIAEYGVDLKFGITVNDPVTSKLAVYDLDDVSGNITTVTAIDPITLAAAGPHSVRSVRFRFAVRTSLPDQNANLIVDPGTSYLARYCPDTACTRWSRVRTIVSEVALMNQAGMDFR